MQFLKRRRNYLVSEQNYHTERVLTEYLLLTEMKKLQILMNKSLNLGLSILEVSRILMYEFWYDYVTPKYDEKAKLFYMDTDIFITYIKTDYIYKNNAEDVRSGFHTSNYGFDRRFHKGKKKNVIGIMKDKLGGKIMIEFV